MGKPIYTRRILVRNVAIVKTCGERVSEKGCMKSNNVKQRTRVASKMTKFVIFLCKDKM